MDKQEPTVASTVEMPQIAKKEINFVLNYEPYACYDAAPRVLAILLKNGVPKTECKILTSPNSRHYWVRWNHQLYTTADLSNLRGSPIVDDRCKELEAEAQERLQVDDQKFEEWVFDSSKDFQIAHEDLVEKIKSPWV